MDESQAVARPWALLALAGVWLAPLVVRLLVRYPLSPVLPFVTWGLAAAIALTWSMPALRRAAFFPDAASRGGASQALGVAGGMTLVGFAIRHVVPVLDPE